MKNAMLILNVLMLFSALFWCYESGFDWEPVIAVLGLVASLVGILISKKGGRVNQLVEVTGSKNKVYQDQRSNSDSLNQCTTVEGNENDITQK